MDGQASLIARSPFRLAVAAGTAPSAIALHRTAQSPAARAVLSPFSAEAAEAAVHGYGLHVLHRDYETRSTAVLRKVGPDRYAADPHTEILCIAYAVDHDPVQLWVPGQPIPQPFIEAANNPSWITAAHNDAFEAAIELHILHPRCGWPLVPIERHRCTMAMALAAGLPAKLGAVADALELSNRKDAGGERLMHQLSKPRRAHKDEDPSGTYWFDDPDRATGIVPH